MGSAIVPAGDHREPGVVTSFERSGQDNFERSIGFPRPLYLIALASDEAIAANLAASVFVDTSLVDETLNASQSERVGRLIDHDQAASMERKKREGYF